MRVIIHAAMAREDPLRDLFSGVFNQEAGVVGLSYSMAKADKTLVGRKTHEPV